MAQLFDTGKDLFASNLGSPIAVDIPRYVGQDLRIGAFVEVKKPVWGLNRSTGERIIEGFKRVKGIVVKLPTKPTPRSFVHLQIGKKIEKITLATFRFGDMHALSGTITPEETFIAHLVKHLTEDTLKGKKHIIDLADECGVKADETQIKELYEVAIMRALKSRLTADVQANYETAQEIYKNQINFAHRTSNSVMLQQYSTPLPLAYVAGAYVVCKQSKNAQYFEPSAGNGLLTVALPEAKTYVNEIDKNRRNNLTAYHNFSKVINQDASKDFGLWADLQPFAGIITNPPFGRWNKETIGGYPISKLEHIMAIRALDTMKDSGRAAIIIGGHTEWDKYDRVENGANRYFLSYLHHFYNVEDIINIDGKMYAKQGTTFPIRLILINGRKAKPEGTAPLKTERDITVRTFEQLWDRMAVYFSPNKTKKASIKLLELLLKEK